MKALQIRKVTGTICCHKFTDNCSISVPVAGGAPGERCTTVCCTICCEVKVFYRQWTKFNIWTWLKRTSLSPKPIWLFQTNNSRLSFRALPLPVFWIIIGLRQKRRFRLAVAPCFHQDYNFLTMRSLQPLHRPGKYLQRRPQLPVHHQMGYSVFSQ